MGSSCLVLGWVRAGGTLMKGRIESEGTELLGLCVKVRLQRSRSPSLGTRRPWAHSLSRIKAPDATHQGQCSQRNPPSSQGSPSLLTSNPAGWFCASELCVTRSTQLTPLRARFPFTVRLEMQPSCCALPRFVHFCCCTLFCCATSPFFCLDLTQIPL